MPYYAVKKGFSPGVFNTWDECKAQVHKFPGAQYKKFPTYDQAIAYSGVSSTASQLTERCSASNPPASTVHARLSAAGGAAHRPAATGRTRASGSAAGTKPYPSSGNGRARPTSANSAAPTQASSSAALCEDMRRCIALARQELASLQHNASRLKSLQVPSSTSATSGAGTATSSTTSSVDAIVDDDDDWGDDDLLLAAAQEADPAPARCAASSAGPDQFIVDSAGYVHVWTDGACSDNGRSGAQAGIGVWFNHAHQLNVSRPVDGPATNNNAEIQAAWMALEVAAAAGHRRVQLHTDSQFLINCATRWVHRWRRNDWRLSSGGAVKNRTQLEALLRALKDVDVKWNYVRGHAGVEGNEGADRLAVEGARRYKPPP